MTSFQKNTLLIGAILGGLGVAIGAFGAHALKDLLLQNNRIDTYELAVKYQFYHSLALLAIVFLDEKCHAKLIAWSRNFFTLGAVIFCGSLYLLSISGYTMLGAVTPIGGVLLIMGWVTLVSAAIKGRLT